MYYAYISECHAENQYFDSLEDARRHMNFWGCVETPFTFDSDITVRDVTCPAFVRLFVREDELPDNFDDMTEEEQQAAIDEAAGDGAYCPCICEVNGNLSDYFDD